MRTSSLAIRVSSLVWWFAVISASGEIAYFEGYRDKATCVIARAPYARTTLRVTTCQLKGGDEDGVQGVPKHSTTF